MVKVLGIAGGLALGLLSAFPASAIEPAREGSTTTTTTSYTTEIAIAYGATLGFSASMLAIMSAEPDTPAPALLIFVGMPAVLLVPPGVHWAYAGPARAVGSFVGLVVFSAAAGVVRALAVGDDDCPPDSDDDCTEEILTTFLIGQTVWAAIDVGDVALNPRVVREGEAAVFLLEASARF